MFYKEKSTAPPNGGAEIMSPHAEAEPFP